MEKTIDENLKNIKTFIPILFALITSIIAFLFVKEIEITKEIAIFLSFTLSLLFIAFIAIMCSLFGKTQYKTIEKKIRIKFSPYEFESYCYLSDKKFINCIEHYAKCCLSKEEIVQLKFIKQKINEFIYRRNCLKIAFIIIVFGSAFLIAFLFLYPFTLK
jgi:hypothetical protein